MMRQHMHFAEDCTLRNKVQEANEGSELTDIEKGNLSLSKAFLKA